MEIDLKQLRELMRALKSFDVNEIEIERGDERIFLRRGGEAAPVQHYAAPPSVATPSRPPETTAKHDEAEPGVAFVTSPFVGTFYRSPSPDAPPFVNVGQNIAPGQVLCIVEAMKLMNEIESEIGGTLLEVLVENGKPVEYGDRLFKIRSL